MKTYLKHISLIVLLILTACSTSEEAIHEDILWYDSPAEKWMQALPVGNGRLGAMVFGDPTNERIQLNEDSMWAGGPDWGNSRGNADDLATVRKLIAEGKVHEADKFLVEKFSYKSIKRSHQTMGDLYIDFGDRDIENYLSLIHI